MEIESPDRFEIVPTINECNELFAYFATKCLESLIKCTRQSLDTLRRRASVSRLLDFSLSVYMTVTTHKNEARCNGNNSRFLLYVRAQSRIVDVPQASFLGPLIE